MQELFIVGPTGNILSLGALGAVSQISAAYTASNGADKGNDACANPIEGQGCTYAHSLSVGGWYDIYLPQNRSTPVSAIYFMNRVTTGCGTGT